MRVHYDEGLATRIGPAPLAVTPKAKRWQGRPLKATSHLSFDAWVAQSLRQAAWCASLIRPQVCETHPIARFSGKVYLNTPSL